MHASASSWAKTKLAHAHADLSWSLQAPAESQLGPEGPSWGQAGACRPQLAGRASAGA
eukprot:NODE_4833_length_760_cov_6.852321_g4035_i0.p3 GENE.NODE_4833_length_760_cov_6.852321_g4035_i0~~NODE_4833_length_760_cov_6.852321_g4035_i0.p3  ORF type:complete len:58 (+),score=6.62 NODE_4833_length_760_cov_6.852321_g4035_i0:494-667(+)